MGAHDRQQLEQVAFGDLTLHPENARRGDLASLVDSIRQLGWWGACGRQRSTGYAIWGNHRYQAGWIAAALMAAAAAGTWTTTDPDQALELEEWKAWPARFGGPLEDVPVFDLDVDDDEARAILVRDNHESDKATWDRPSLASLLTAIDEARGVEAAGFDRTSFDKLVRETRPRATHEREEDDPALGPAPAVPFTRPGDLWALGPHLVLCGDSTDPDSYRRLGLRRPDLVVTDPPYGVDIGAKNRTLQQFDRAGRALDDLAGDTGEHDAVELWEAAFPQILDVLPAGMPYYVFGPGAGPLGHELGRVLRDVGYNPRHLLIWVKDRATFSLGRLDYEYRHEPIIHGHKPAALRRPLPRRAELPALVAPAGYGEQHETILYGWAPGAAHPWYATDGQQTTVLEYPRPKRSPEHATIKPVALLEQLITNSSPPRGLVLDPFAGTGSTLVAAEQTGRDCNLIELRAGYVDLICRRWQTTTGVLPEFGGPGGRPHDFHENS